MPIQIITWLVHVTLEDSHPAQTLWRRLFKDHLHRTLAWQGRHSYTITTHTRMEAQRAAQTMSAVCFTSCHDDYVRPFGWTKFVIIYIANAAWLLRPLNILVCYFMMPASMRPTKKYYISERRLTLMISHTSSEWRLRPPTTTTASSQTCARGDPSIERLPRLSSLPSTSSFRRFHAASPR